MKAQHSILLVLFLAMQACDQAPMRLAQAEISVQLVAPEDGADLALSEANQVTVQVDSPQAKVSDLWLIVRPEGCAPGHSCPETVLHRRGSQLVNDRVDFCLTTQLAPADLCADEDARIDVTGYIEGHHFILEALAQSAGEPTGQARSASRSLVLRDDRAPLVMLQNSIPQQDGIFGPGDRIPIALRVVDEQSGIQSVQVQVTGLAGLADRVEDWFVPPQATELEGLTTIFVPASYVCPGSYSLRVVATDKAEPANVTTMDFGPGCVGTCSDRDPPTIHAFNVDVLQPDAEGSLTVQNRNPAYVKAGESLRIDDIPLVDNSEQLLGEISIELVYAPPGQVVQADKDRVVGQFHLADDGQSYVYTLRGDEEAGPYFVRVTAVDSHCNSAVKTQPILVDYTPVPEDFSVSNRQSTFLQIHWQLPTSSIAPRHLYWQALGRDASIDPANYTLMSPEPSPEPVRDGELDTEDYQYYVHQNLQPATRYAYRLIMESATTPGLMLNPADLFDRPADNEASERVDLCTLPAAPSLTSLDATQDQVSATVGLGENPPGTPLHMWRCLSSACTNSNNCARTAIDDNCIKINENNILDEGLQTISDLQDGQCYALVLRAQGCGDDIADTVQCIATKAMLPAPLSISLKSSSTDGLSVEWQRLLSPSSDAVVGYDVQVSPTMQHDESVFVAQPADAESKPSYEATGLVAGQKVLLRVRGKLASGAVGRWSNAVTFFSRVNTPEAALFSARQTNSLSFQISTQGNQDNCDTEYSVEDLSVSSTERHLQANGLRGATPFWAVAGTGCNSPFSQEFTYTGLSPNSRHNLVVHARNAHGLEAESPSPEQSWVTLAAQPQAPVVTSDHAGGIVVTFAAAPNPDDTEMALLAGLGSDVLNQTQFVQAGGGLLDSEIYQSLAQWNALSGVQVHGLIPNQQYSFALRARNASGSDPLVPQEISANGPSASAWTRAAQPLALHETAHAFDQISLAWESNGNAAGTAFKVEYLPVTISSSQTITVNRGTFTNLAANKMYAFQVTALRLDPSGEDSVVSQTVDIPTAAATPFSPVVSARDASHFELSLTNNFENPPVTETALLVDGAFVDSAGQEQIVLDDALTIRSDWPTTVNIACDSPGQSHSLASLVRGIDENVVVSATIRASCNPVAASSLSLQAGQDSASQMDLTWGDGGNNASVVYDVERCLGSCTEAGPWATLVSGVSTRVFRDSSLLAAQTYSYRLRALVPTDGATTPAFSTIVSAVTTPVQPAAPTLTLLDGNQISSLNVGLADSNNSAQSLYAVQLWSAGSSVGWLQAAGTLAATPFYQSLTTWGASKTVTGLQTNTPYTAQLVAQNSAGFTSPASPESAEVYTAAQAPGINSLVASNVTQIAATLSWDAVNCTNYWLERGTDGINYSQIYQGPLTSFNDSSLSADTTYHYRLYSLNAQDVKSLSSSETSFTTLSGLPLAPDLPVVTNAAGAQNTTVSDNPITVLQPYFSATHHDEAAPTQAVQAQLYVRRKSDQVMVLNKIFDTITPVENGARVQDLRMPYLIQPLPNDAFGGDALSVVGAPDQDLIFVMQGDGTKHFWELNSLTNVWTQRADSNRNIGDGSDMTYSPDDNRLYVLDGGGGQHVMRYDLAAQTWADQSAGSCGGVSANGAMANDYLTSNVADETHLFVFPGSGSKTYVHRVNTGDWNCTQMPLLPVNLAASGAAGSDMLVVGHTLFFQAGHGQAGLYAYDLTQLNFGTPGTWGSWSTVVPTGVALPAVGVTGSLEKLSDSSLAIFSGGSTPKLYLYDFTSTSDLSGVLSVIDNAPTGGWKTINTGGSRLAYQQTINRIFVVQGQNRALWSAYVDLSQPLQSLVGYPGDNYQAIQKNNTFYEYWIRFADSDDWSTKWSPVQEFSLVP